MTRPRMLDLCACEGGAAFGYVMAGWDVTSVDLLPQRKYPKNNPHMRLVVADAVRHLAELISTGAIRRYSAIHASPPCQRWTAAQRLMKNDHPDLITPLRPLLVASGLPYVIENVEGAPLIDPITLCGTMFGLSTHRHRLFESNVPLLAPPHPEHTDTLVKMGRRVQWGDWYHAVGHFSDPDKWIYHDMGVEWMSRRGAAECIPPKYARHVGVQVRAAVEAGWGLAA